jgi:LPS O-antigen subunit length determinant protein (WzzB/FepE family)
MSEFQSALKPYDLDASLAADRGDDCFVVDVGRDESGQPVASLQHVVDTVENYIAQANDSVFSATKLYIVGEWNLTTNQAQDELDSNEEVIKVSLYLSRYHYAEET